MMQKKNRVVQLRTARFCSQVTRLYKNTLVVTSLRYALPYPKRANFRLLSMFVQQHRYRNVIESLTVY